MIGEIALAIEMGADAVDIGKTIHLHPTLGDNCCDAGGGGGAWQLYGFAASPEVIWPSSYPSASCCNRSGALRDLV